MKFNKDQILEKSKKILKDLRKERFKEEIIEDTFFDKKDELIRGDNKGKTHPTWTTSILAPFDNTDFLTISDETGEPLYYQNFNMIIYEIDKDSDGKYFRKENNV